MFQTDRVIQMGWIKLILGNFHFWILFVLVWERDSLLLQRWNLERYFIMVIIRFLKYFSLIWRQVLRKNFTKNSKWYKNISNVERFLRHHLVYSIRGKENSLKIFLQKLGWHHLTMKSSVREIKYNPLKFSFRNSWK